MPPAIQPLHVAGDHEAFGPGASAGSSASVRKQLASQRPYLLAVARSIAAGNDSDAQDLVQETCRRALEHEDQFVVDTNLRGWLTCILRNVHRDRSRRATFEILTPQIADVVATCSPREASGVPAWRCVDDDDLARAMKHLPPPYRSVYTLRAAGWGYDDIARELGISAQTVATRIHRARLCLRRSLSQAGARGSCVPLPASLLLSDGGGAL